jgi:hypothetical protein
MSQTDVLIRCHSRTEKLALRMTRHGARSSTVSAWTGISLTRIGTLVHQSLEAPRGRYQARTPLRVDYFFRTPGLKRDAALLGILFELLEVVPADTSSRSFPTLIRGEGLCCAYEMYSDMVDVCLIEFEQAVLLATALAEGEGISLQSCPRCEEAVLVGYSAPAGDACTHCRSEALPPVIAGKFVELARQACPPTLPLLTKSDLTATAKEHRIHHTKVVKTSSVSKPDTRSPT